MNKRQGVVELKGGSVAFLFFPLKENSNFFFRGCAWSGLWAWGFVINRWAMLGFILLFLFALSG